MVRSTFKVTNVFAFFCKITFLEDSLSLHSEKKKIYLQDDGRPRFDLQDAGIPQCIKSWIGVVGKGRVVEDEEGGHVVQDEAKLIWMKAGLRSLSLCVDDRRSQAGHCGVVHHRTHLTRATKIIYYSTVQIHF